MFIACHGELLLIHIQRSPVSTVTYRMSPCLDIFPASKTKWSYHLPSQSLLSSFLLIYHYHKHFGIRKHFPDSSADIESTCNAGDPGSIPGSGRSAEGISYPPQYSWASLVVQLVKNPPAIQETLVRFLGREDPGERDRLRTPVFLGFPGGLDRRTTIHGVTKSQTQLSD